MHGPSQPPNPRFTTPRRTDHIEGLAESNGFVVAHPDGVKVAGGPGGVWNGGMCCGIGVVAGTLGVETCDPAQPVSVLHVHGTADENLPITGGVGLRSIAGVDFPPPPGGFATLADRDGCPEPEESTEGGSDVTVTRRQPCDEGTAAAFVTIDGASHAWPGGTPRATPPSGAGDAGYDATAEIVAFLLDHPRP